MAKIFVTFFNGVDDPNNPDAMPCFYEGFLQELVKNGNEVMYADDHDFLKTFCSIPQKLLNKIKLFNPDLIILFNNFFYDVSKEFDCPIVIWEADSYLYYPNKEVLKADPNRFRYVVAQSCEENELANYFGAYKKNIFYLPFATAIQAEDVQQNLNISFIGTGYVYSRMIGNFLLSYPSIEEKKVFMLMLNDIKQHPFFQNEDFFRKWNVTSQKIKRFFDVNQAVCDLSAEERINILDQISSLGLTIYGTNSWARIPYRTKLAFCYDNKLIYSIKNNQDVYNRSKISLNISHIQAQSGFSWRVCDVMASNSCLITEPKTDLKKLFPQIKFFTYNNQFEAREMCQKLLQSKSTRKEFVHQCQTAIEDNYRFSHRIKELSQIIETKIFNNNQIGSLCHLNARKKSTLLEKLDLNLSTKRKLVGLGGALIVNQIPIINKFFINRDQITERIEKTIEYEKINKH